MANGIICAESTMLSIDRLEPAVAGEAFVYQIPARSRAANDPDCWEIEVFRSGAAELRLGGVTAAIVQADDGLCILDTNREPWDRASALVALMDASHRVQIDDLARARITNELARWISREFD
jgi:hypothetical protein